MRFKEITPLTERLRNDFVPAGYGYWVKPDGTILNVDKNEGHVDFLMDIDEFIHISPTASKAEFYTDALNNGWVRVIAKVADHREMTIHFQSLNSRTRAKITDLILGLGDYQTYWFSSQHMPLYDAQRAIQFVRDFTEQPTMMAAESFMLPH